MLLFAAASLLLNVCSCGKCWFWRLKWGAWGAEPWVDCPMSQLLCQKWLFAQTLLHVAVCDERKQDSCLIFGIWKKMAPFQLFPNMENGQICPVSILLAWLSNFDRCHRNLNKKCRTRCALHLARKTCSWLQLSEYIAFFRNYYYLFRNYIYLYLFFNT